MKKTKAQWKQLTRQILALGLAVVLVSGMTDFSVLAEDAEKPTVTSEGTVAGKTAENPIEEDTEVETTSGNTVTLLKSKVQEAEPEDDEAGIAVQSTSDLIEVKIGNYTNKYSSFDQAMKDIDYNAKHGYRWFEIKLLGDVKVDSYYSFSTVSGDDSEARFVLDLNGYNLGSENTITNAFLYFYPGWNVKLQDSGTNLDNKAYMKFLTSKSVKVESGRYSTIEMNNKSGTGYFLGGSVDTIKVIGGHGYIYGGNYGEIVVQSGQSLEIEEGSGSITKLSIDPSAAVTLEGGTYGTIEYSGDSADSGDLSSIVQDPYVLISTDEKTEGEILDISGKNSVSNVKVAKATDTTKPTWEATAGSSDQYGIQVKGTWYNSLPDTVSFDKNLYNDNTLDIAIRATDDTGIAKYYYYIQMVDSSNIAEFHHLNDAELDELRNKGKFKKVTLTDGNDVATVSGAITESNKNYVIYAYAVDTAGNRSAYVCTDGIVLDNIAPNLSNHIWPNKDNGQVTDTEVTIKFTLQEDVTFIYLYVDEQTEGENIKSVQEQINKYIESQNMQNKGLPFAILNDGKWQPSCEDGAQVKVANVSPEVKRTLHVVNFGAGDRKIKISDLIPDENVYIWFIAIDKAGNKSSVWKGYVHTNKLSAQLEIAPSVTGIYGDYPNNLKIDGGKVSYNGTEIAGTWKITESGSTKFEAGTKQQCEVTFTPTDDQYEPIVTHVIPTIEKRQITITAKTLSITYGEDLPQINSEVFTINNFPTSLAYEDNYSTVANTLHYVTDAKKGANAGLYPYTLVSNSTNYEVNVEYIGEGATSGNLYIRKAQGVISKTDNFKESITVTFGDTAFPISDWVTANHTETTPSYRIMEAKNRRDKKDQIVTVTPEGMVEIHNAGTATIRISLPKSTNYESSDYKKNYFDVVINVEPKSITWGPIIMNYLYTKGGHEELSVESLLPEDFGSKKDVIGKDIEVSAPEDFFALAGYPTAWYIGGNPSYPSCIEYGIKSGDIGKTAQITWPLDTNNYIINEDNVVTIQLVLVDRKVVKLQGEKVNLQNTLTYGQALSELKFGDNTFVDSDTGEVVPGTLEWSTPNATPDAGTYQAEWKFTPEDTDTYIGCTRTVAITVNKATPSEVSAPVLHNYPYRPAAIGKIDDLLSNSYYLEQQGIVKGIKGEELKGIWSWVNPDLIPEIGEHTLKIRFTPEDQNYNPVESNITLNVVKAVPYIYPSPSVEKAYTHGDYLSSQKLQNGVAYSLPYASEAGYTVLEGTFTWEEPDTLLTYWSYNHDVQTKYRYVFTPKDQEHYEPKTGQVTIVVNRAEYPPTVPGDINVKNSCTTLRNVTLPEGWSFYEADLNTELKVDDPVKVTVFYEDNYNYIKTTKEITVTRSSCDHEKTERREVVKATCIAEGNTGYLWCLECNTKLEEGTVTPKDPTNHTALTSKVIKQPTTSEEGIMEYTCSACGYSATKAIAKITSTSSDTGSSSGSQSNNDDKPAPTPTPTPVATPVPAVTPIRPNRIPVKPTVKEEPKTPAPFLRGENGKEGWAVITETVTEAEDGDTVIVDMNGSSVVPGDVFDRIRGKDITVEFDLGNGILWKVNGQSVEKGNVGDIDFTVRAGEDANDTIPLEIINNLTGERTYMNLSLAYEGEFGFEAVLSLNVGTANAGLYANLFYYNEATKELEFLCAGEIGQDGGAELTFTHASEYTIVIDEQPMETDQSQAVTSETGVQDNQEDNTVNIAPEVENTGHTALLIFCIILIAAAFIVIGVIVFVKKNKKEE